MKKAVISTGGKQYLVAEGDTLEVELLKAGGKTAVFDPLLVISDENILIGSPTVEGAKVNAEIVAEEVQADKVTSVRYKSKKRVHKVHGHRQKQTQIKIIQIFVK